MAGDWADADSSPAVRATSSSSSSSSSSKVSAYDANADAVEQERASMHKSVQNAPASTERSTATPRRATGPVSAKVQAAAKAAADDWANADDVKQVARPAVAKVQAAKAAMKETPDVSTVARKPPAGEPADEAKQIAKPAAEKAAAAATVLNGRKEPRKVDAGSTKKPAASLRKRGRH